MTVFEDAFNAAGFHKRDMEAFMWAKRFINDGGDREGWLLAFDRAAEEMLGVGQTFSVVKGDQFGFADTEPPIPDGGHAADANSGQIPYASTGNSIVDGDQSPLVSNDQSLDVPVDAPIASEERPPLVSPSGQVLDASPARELHADVDDQPRPVHQDHGSNVVHVRSHERLVPTNYKPKLPTEEQRAAARRAMRNTVVGAYQIKGSKSMRNEKIREQPVLRDKSIKKAGIAMEKGVLPKLTEAGVRQRLINSAESNSQIVAEVADPLTFNKMAEDSYLDSITMVRKSMETIESQITKGR